MKREESPAPPPLAPGSIPGSAPPKLHAVLAPEENSGSSERSGGPPKRQKSQAKHEPIFARIANHDVFQNTTMSVIVLNALWIGADTEWNNAALKRNGKYPLEPYSTITENLFCGYFSVELLIRFIAFRVKSHCIYDAWFVFDSVLVACMVLETWLMPLIGLLAGGGGGGSALASLSPFRLLRLLRLTRMARLMRFVPEMMTLVKGIIAAGRSVGFIFLFLVMVIYVFAILFTSQLEDRKEYPLTEEGEEAQDLFATLGCSMMSLFTRGVLGDNLSETVQAILDKSVWLMWAFWVFFIITFATLLNMLIGVLCEVISSSAEDEAEQQDVKGIRDDLETAFDELDEDSNGMVTNREWDQMKRHPKVFSKLCAIFEDRVDERLEQIEELFFGKDFVGVQADDGDKRPDNGLPLDDVIDQIIAMRPNQNASALDMEMLHRNVELDQEFVMKTLHNAEENLRRLLGPDAAERCPHKTLLVKKKSSEKFRTSASNRFGD